MSNKQLTIGLIAVAIIAIAGWFFPLVQGALGTAGSRFPNGVSANTTSPSIAGQLRGTTLLIDTSNTATSTTALGCIQWYATSTATALHFSLTQSTLASTTYSGNSTNAGFMVAQYGACPA